MKKKWNAILATGLIGAAIAANLMPLRAAEVSEQLYTSGWNTRDTRRPAMQPMPHPRHVTKHEPSDTSAPSDEPEDVLGYIPDHRWQRYAEWKEDNVYFLRGSSNRLVKKGEIVILRWRSPKEFARRDYLSSRGFSPAEQLLEAARLKDRD